MAKINTTGIDEYIASLKGIADDGHLCGEAVYEAAGIVADAVRAQIDQIPDSSFPKDYQEKWERDALKQGIGVSRMKVDDGVVNVKIGFNGYANWKDGKGRTPIAVIARSITAGASNRKKYAFVRLASKSVESRATETMRKAVEAKVEQDFKK